MPDDVSRADMTQKFEELSTLKDYLKNILIANSAKEIEERQAILEDLDDIKDMVKIMNRLIKEQLFKELFPMARKEVAPRLAGVIARTKSFKIATGLTILFTEIFEKMN